MCVPANVCQIWDGMPSSEKRYAEVDGCGILIHSQLCPAGARGQYIREQARRQVRPPRLLSRPPSLPNSMLTTRTDTP